MSYNIDALRTAREALRTAYHAAVTTQQEDVAGAVAFLFTVANERVQFAKAEELLVAEEAANLSDEINTFLREVS